VVLDTKMEQLPLALHILEGTANVPANLIQPLGCDESVDKRTMVDQKVPLSGPTVSYAEKKMQTASGRVKYYSHHARANPQLTAWMDKSVQPVENGSILTPHSPQHVLCSGRCGAREDTSTRGEKS